MSQIQIFLHNVDNTINSVSVNPYDPVKVLLNKNSKSNNMLLMYNNTIIHQQFSFQFFKISNNDHVFVIFNEPISKKVNFLNDRISNSSNPLMKEINMISNKIHRVPSPPSFDYYPSCDSIVLCNAKPQLFSKQTKPSSNRLPTFWEPSTISI